MIVEAFIICDAATQQGGKLNVLGAFDCIHARGVPVSHPHCAIVLRVRFSRIEQGDHRIRINLIDEDGNHVVPALEGRTRIQIGEGQESVVANMILALNGLTFQTYGRYEISLTIDGKQVSSMPLYVRGIQETPLE